ncbi:hypothetical protein PS683_03765 [Pseudomonas fluorescens]|uniref:Uncharacterized protein n=1 Tax=Pseudomonas fluorescens TaxID=294 RepID=A0A5E6MVL9_PSEFL|nr:hypothetical protein PS683_03765 [Pseudomonas fluorescens]VVN09443.1 hypothetical protein PS683_03765 [Pseudomonas fluorescens]
MATAKPATTPAAAPSAIAKSEETNKFGVVFPVVCTLLGVFATAGFTWLSGHQTASVTERNACIARIDQQEKQLREKGDMFLSTIGDFLNYTTFPANSSVGELAKFAGPLIKAGFVMTAYAPPELSLQSLKISNSVRDGALASMNKGDPEKAISQAKEAFEKWPEAYLNALADLNSLRGKCK